jgi:Family of unknown function (DUF6529)
MSSIPDPPVVATLDGSPPSVPQGWHASGTRPLLAAAIAGAAVSLALGTYGNVHEPTGDSIATFGFPAVLPMKAWFATAVLALALAQLVSALALWGRVPAVRSTPAWLAPVHRWSGTGTVPTLAATATDPRTEAVGVPVRHPHRRVQAHLGGFRRQGAGATIRSRAGTAMPPGSAAVNAAASASMSWAPPSASVPSLNTVNPSPPAARKLFIVTRNESVGVTSTSSTHIRPILPSQVDASGDCS